MFDGTNLAQISDVDQHTKMFDLSEIPIPIIDQLYIHNYWMHVFVAQTGSRARARTRVCVCVLP